MSNEFIRLNVSRKPFVSQISFDNTYNHSPSVIPLQGPCDWSMWTNLGDYPVVVTCDGSPWTLPSNTTITFPPKAVTFSSLQISAGNTTTVQFLGNQLG